MSDFKTCITCEGQMNSLDDHGQCYKHRICNAAFPCDVCEGWSLEKRSQIDRMIEKSVKKNSATTTCTITRPPASVPENIVVDVLQSPFTGNMRANPVSSQSLLTGNITTNPVSSPQGNGQFPLFAGMSNFMMNSANQSLPGYNPFMWMMNPLSYQNSIQELIDKKVQEALGSSVVATTSASTGTITSVVSTISTSGPICTTSSSGDNSQSNPRRFNRLAPESQYEDISDNESLDRVSLRAPPDSEYSERQNHDQEDAASRGSGNTSFLDQNLSVFDFDVNNNLAWSNFMSKVANNLNIECSDGRIDKDKHFTSYIPEHMSQKAHSQSLKVRLPLDGMILESVHSLDKEFRSRGNLIPFKAKDDEKFQVLNEHYEKYCSVPKLDLNVEEGLASCTAPQSQSFKKTSGNKSKFRFKNKALFDHNSEIKRVDVQARLLLRACSYGTLITSYLSKNLSDDATEGLQALLQVFSTITDVAARMSVKAVVSRRNLHLQEMAFKNKSTEEKLRSISTIGSSLFGGEYFDLLHDSAENIRDARKTQHLRKSFKPNENRASQQEGKSVTKRKLPKEQNDSEAAEAKKSKFNRNKDYKQRSMSGFKRRDTSVNEPKKGQLGFRPPK